MSKMVVYYEGELKTRTVLQSQEEDSTKVLWTNASELSKDSAFSPTDLLAVSLGSCVATMMALKAKSLNIDLSGLKVFVEKEMSKTSPRRIGRLTVFISCPASFGIVNQQILENTALSCPIHESLHPDVSQEFNFSWGK